jgi:SpoVK/Ycf46/Vps4 family AAA+-type ATPase
MVAVERFVRFLQFYADPDSLVPVQYDTLLKGLDNVIKSLIGVDEIVTNLKNWLIMMTEPLVRTPRGVLLWGPQEQGKTLVTRNLSMFRKTTLITKVCDNTDVFLVAPKFAAGDFNQGIVGDSEKMINEVAERAKLVRHSKIF